MNRFSMSNAALRMSYKVSQKEIEKIVDRLGIVPSEDVEIADAQEVRVAAVQLLLRRYSSLSDYVVDMNTYVADAVNRRAEIVCFPAFAGLLPASFLPQFEAASKALRIPQPEAALDPVAVGEYLSYFSDVIFDAYYHTMAALATRHRVYIMAGSSLCYDQNTLCHRALFFDKSGNLAGVQDKLSLSPLERDLGVEPAGELKVFPSPVGPVAMLIGEDANYYEIAHVARSLGARVLLHPAAFAGEYTPVRSTLGLNMRAQENQAYGVQSVLVGDTGLGFAAEGVCCIFGPVDLTRTKNGTIARSSGSFQPDVLCASLHVERLSRLRNPYREDRNIEFLEKYIDRLI